MMHASVPSLPPVVVLCGGLGTRLRGVVGDRPKVLAPINGTPFLYYLLAYLRRQGVREVVLSTGHLGEMVAEAAGDGSRWDLHVRCVQEPDPLGTGGALRYAVDTLGLPAPFLTLNGDTFFSGDLSRLAAFHQELPGAAATLALVRVEQAVRYGTVAADETTGVVEAFREKDPNQKGPAWISAGVYMLGSELIASIPAGRNVSIERDVFPRWIGAGLYGCRFQEAAFLDIGTPDDYTRAASMLDSGL